MTWISEDKRMLGYELLNSFPNISHFTTTRMGGLSKGNYASFNCTGYTGDDPEDVLSNQKLLIESLPAGIRQLVIPRQVHGTGIMRIDSDELLTGEQLDGIDALITHRKGFCLCVSTADCIPLLLYDKEKQIIAAIHAGWRGTVQGITRKVLSEMQHIYGTLS